MIDPNKQDKQSQLRQFSFSYLEEQIQDIDPSISGLEKTKFVIALIKIHLKGTLAYHRDGWLGFFGVTTSRLVTAYQNALNAFPKELVDATPASYAAERIDWIRSNVNVITLDWELLQFHSRRIK